MIRSLFGHGNTAGMGFIDPLSEDWQRNFDLGKAGKECDDTKDENSLDGWLTGDAERGIEERKS